MPLAFESEQGKSFPMLKEFQPPYLHKAIAISLARYDIGVFALLKTTEQCIAVGGEDDFSAAVERHSGLADVEQENRILRSGSKASVLGNVFLKGV